MQYWQRYSRFNVKLAFLKRRKISIKQHIKFRFSLFVIVVLAKRIHLYIKGLTIISFTNQEIMSSKVFWIIFLPKLRFPNGNKMLKFLSTWVITISNKLLIINFYEQNLKLNLQENNLNLSLKITYKDKITDIKKILCKVTNAVNLPWLGIFIFFFLPISKTSCRFRHLYLRQYCLENELCHIKI